MTSADIAFRRYRTDGSHDAFREVVACHLPMVYGTALRLGQGNAAEAEDISQMVFADLARKASSLREDAAVGAWLHRHTCFLMKNALRSDIRRRTREVAAMELSTLSGTSDIPDEQWEQIENRLDQCLESLGESDRRVLILRFSEGRALRDVGNALGIGDDAAQKRVSRALDRLRALVTGRRSAISSMSLAAAISTRVRADVPVSVATPLARSALQLAGARTGALAASGGSAAVATAWAGVAVTFAFGLWRSWPHWQSQAASMPDKSSFGEPALTKRAEAVRESPGAPAAMPAAGVAENHQPGTRDLSVTGNRAAAAESAIPRKKKTPEEQEKDARSKAGTMFKWMVAYGLDHGGHFPPDMSALFSGPKHGAQYGFPVDKAGEWLKPVVEYRGRKLTLSDEGRLVMMRYRIEEDAEKEVRLLVTGEVRVCPVNEPMPEEMPAPDSIESSQSPPIAR